RRLHAGDHAVLLDRLLQRHLVHHGGEHADVVGTRTVHALGRLRYATEDVATADHDRDLDTELRCLGDFGRDHAQDIRVDPVALATHQRLARNLEKHALVGGFAWLGHRARTLPKDDGRPTP